jgi:diguanylate cyclase (GGDEF)-like protein/PAS domain S-box-containing protein
MSTTTAHRPGDDATCARVPPRGLAALREQVRQRWTDLQQTVSDPRLAGQLRARQLQAVQRLTPLAMVANGLNAALVVIACAGTGHDLFLALWSAAVVGVMLQAALSWQRMRQRPAPAQSSPRSMRRATRNASVLATVWAAMPAMLLADADGGRQLLISVITTGMMCAGGFALATVPVAGTAYVLLLGLGGAVALWSSALPFSGLIGALLSIYAAIVIASVWSTARLFTGRLIAEAEAARQNELVGLLLRDFEEHASDALWEIGADGRLRHVSARLETLFGLSAAELAAMPILEHLRRLTPDDPVARIRLRELRQRLAGLTAFRDLPLAGRVGGDIRWWSISAKPLLDEHGLCVGWRGVASDVTDIQTATNQLAWLAHNDSLTGLSNRHQFRSALQSLLTSDVAAGRQLAVLCLDLDHFKIVNDTLGHACGDALLQEVGRRLQSVVRRTDIAARLGGDEFAIVWRHVKSAREVEQLTQRVLQCLTTPCQVQEHRLMVHTSIGAAMAPRDGEDVDTLINHADVALYAAKAAGRGMLRFYDPEMAETTHRRVALEEGLRHALQAGQFSLVFQPQARVIDRHITGFEALLRWRHPELGEVTPTEFIPIAEETGLMPVIGRWVLEEACRQAASWPGHLTVAVNVSPMQVMVDGFVDVALNAARAAGIAPQRLEVEITESAFLREGQATVEVLHALRRVGLRIALDDFGTGYSALGYLRRFPFNTLKIDRSFVKELLTRSDSRVIVRTITGLAHAMNMQVVAEGVEEAEHAAVLARYGCDLMQGYLLSRPVPGHQVATLLANWCEPSDPLPEVGATMAMPLSAF